MLRKLIASVLALALVSPLFPLEAIAGSCDLTLMNYCAALYMYDLTGKLPDQQIGQQSIAVLNDEELFEGFHQTGHLYVWGTPGYQIPAYRVEASNVGGPGVDQRTVFPQMGDGGLPIDAEVAYRIPGGGFALPGYLPNGAQIPCTVRIWTMRAWSMANVCDPTYCTLIHPETQILPRFYNPVTKQQKRDIAWSISIAGLVTGWISRAPGPQKTYLLALTATLQAIAAGLWASTVDPPDSNYTVIAQPPAPIVVSFPAGAGFNQQKINKLNDWAVSAALLLGQVEVHQRSLKRLEGARNAGDQNWMNWQRQAAQDASLSIYSRLGDFVSKTQDVYNSMKNDKVFPIPQTPMSIEDAAAIALMMPGTPEPFMQEHSVFSLIQPAGTGYWPAAASTAVIRDTITANKSSMLATVCFNPHCD